MALTPAFTTRNGHAAKSPGLKPISVQALFYGLKAVAFTVASLREACFALIPACRFVRRGAKRRAFP
jgi:hypothetical protein